MVEKRREFHDCVVPPVYISPTTLLRPESTAGVGTSLEAVAFAVEAHLPQPHSHTATQVRSRAHTAPRAGQQLRTTVQRERGRRRRHGGPAGVVATSIHATACGGGCSSTGEGVVRRASSAITSVATGLTAGKERRRSSRTAAGTGTRVSLLGKHRVAEGVGVASIAAGAGAGTVGAVATATEVRHVRQVRRRRHQTLRALHGGHGGASIRGAGGGSTSGERRVHAGVVATAEAGAGRGAACTARRQPRCAAGGPSGLAGAVGVGVAGAIDTRRGRDHGCRQRVVAAAGGRTARSTTARRLGRRRWRQRSRRCARTRCNQHG